MNIKSIINAPVSAVKVVGHSASVVGESTVNVAKTTKALVVIGGGAVVNVAVDSAKVVGSKTVTVVKTAPKVRLTIKK